MVNRKIDEIGRLRETDVRWNLFIQLVFCRICEISMQMPAYEEIWNDLLHKRFLLRIRSKLERFNVGFFIFFNLTFKFELTLIFRTRSASSGRVCRRTRTTQRRRWPT